MIHKNVSRNSNRILFNGIDKSLLFGINCASGNQTQQDYFEILKFQTESVFVNKNFKQVKLLAI